MSHSDEQLHSALATLDACRKVLKENDARDTAEMLSIVILDLRMKLKGIASTELRALCDEILLGPSSEPASGSNLAEDRPRRPLLRIVK